jgi:hypothetical protein
MQVSIGSFNEWFEYRIYQAGFGTGAQMMSPDPDAIERTFTGVEARKTW